MTIASSTSEDHGIALLTPEDKLILSVGISTGGVAEIRMAENNPDRRIIATTLDSKGIPFAEEYIAKKGLGAQIETKLEDVSQPLNYPDNHFNYIYARLVLHYLSEEKLRSTLLELHRILKPGGKLYIVVRSDKCPDATDPSATYDPVTHLTSGTKPDDKTGGTYSYTRFFHNEDSISGYVKEAGFTIDHVTTYDETLFEDFMHTIPTQDTDNVIELLAVK